MGQPTFPQLVAGITFVMCAMHCLSTLAAHLGWWLL